MLSLAELLSAVEANQPLSWPFLKPVDPAIALDYYDVIIDPIDLSLIRSRLGCQQYYVSLEMFVADLRKMCDNCRCAHTLAIPLLTLLVFLGLQRGQSLAA